MKSLGVVLLFISCVFATGTPCVWFGGTLQSAGAVDVYSTNQACDGFNTCDDFKGSLTCFNGVLSGATEYAFDECTVIDCSCNTTGGAILTHGEDAYVYSAETNCNDCGIIQGTVHCNASVLSGDTGYAYDSCNVSDCTCNVNGFIINNTETKILYLTNSALCANCDGYAYSVTCQDGVPDQNITGLDYDTCDSSCNSGTTGSTGTGASCTFLGQTINDADHLTVYQDDHPCGTCVSGTVDCTDGSLSGDQGYQYLTCTPSSCGGTGGDPHFFGFKGQKYDVMGQSHEIYNFMTSSNLQINSRFIPYYKTAYQIVPTGTMMGEIAIKFGTHRFHVFANETVGVLDNIDLDLLASWSIEFDGATLSNVNERGRMYQIGFENRDVSVNFIRKLYAISGVEDQWHFDYKAKLLTEEHSLHGYLSNNRLDLQYRLMGQTWKLKNFKEKSGAFKYLDGEEDNYRIKSNNIFGDDFDFNKFNKSQ